MGRKKFWKKSKGLYEEGLQEAGLSVEGVARLNAYLERIEKDKRIDRKSFERGFFTGWKEALNM